MWRYQSEEVLFLDNIWLVSCTCFFNGSRDLQMKICRLYNNSFYRLKETEYSTRRNDQLSLLTEYIPA